MKTSFKEEELEKQLQNQLMSLIGPDQMKLTKRAKTSRPDERINLVKSSLKTTKTAVRRGLIGVAYKAVGKVTSIIPKTKETLEKGNWVSIGTKEATGVKQMFLAGTSGKSAYFGDDVVTEWNKRCVSMGGYQMVDGKDAPEGTPVNLCPFPTNPIVKNAKEIRLISSARSPTVAPTPTRVTEPTPTPLEPPLVARPQDKEAIEQWASDLEASFRADRPDCVSDLKNAWNKYKEGKVQDAMEIIVKSNGPYAPTDPATSISCNIPMLLEGSTIKAIANRLAFFNLANEHAR